MLNLALYNNETDGPLRRLDKADGQERQLELNAYDIHDDIKRDGGGGGATLRYSAQLSHRTASVTVRLCICVSTSRSGSCPAGEGCTW